MMNVTYGVAKEIYSLGSSSRISYGIAAYADTEKDGTATIVAFVHDVTSNKQALDELVSLCNRLKLSIVHLEDVVKDFQTNCVNTAARAALARSFSRRLTEF